MSDFDKDINVPSKDIVYRQDAIDAICKACSMEGDYHKCDGYPETSTWCDELVALRALPSAQPEIVRCKDCEHQPFDSEDTQGFGFEFPDERCPCQCDDFWYSWRPDNDWFCGNAERRTE